MKKFKIGDRVKILPHDKLEGLVFGLANARAGDIGKVVKIGGVAMPSAGVVIQNKNWAQGAKEYPPNSFWVSDCRVEKYKEKIKHMEGK